VVRLGAELDGCGVLRLWLDLSLDLERADHVADRATELPRDGYRSRDAHLSLDIDRRGLHEAPDA